MAILQNIPLFKEKVKPNVIATSVFSDFNHIDFVYSKDILQVNEKIAAIIRRHKMIKNSMIY